MQATFSASRRTILKSGGSLFLSAVAAKGVRAASYPDSPITLVVPLPAGSILDVIGRIASDKFRQDLHEPFVIENLPGATSNLGTARVAHSPPDGKTVLLTVNSPVAINQFLFKNMTFDPERDLSPVILTSFTPLALAVNPSFPARTVQEYIDYARAHPGQLTYGSSGVGSTPHLIAEFLSSLTGIKLLHVPYKGTPETITDLVAGHIQSSFIGIGLVSEQARAGQLRILAVTENNRLSQDPEIPTIHETVPQFVNAPGAWHGMYVPAHTPQNVIDVLNHEMNVVLRDPHATETLRKAYIFPLGGPPQALLDRARLERATAGALIKKIGIKPQ